MKNKKSLFVTIFAVAITLCFAVLFNGNSVANVAHADGTTVWASLAGAMSGETFEPCDSFSVEDNAEQGTRYIKLLKNIVADADGTSLIVASKTVKITLDLNGFIIDRNTFGVETPNTDGNTITVSHGDLTIKDSNPDAVHKYTVNENGVWIVDDTATGNDVKTLKGGVITGAYASLAPLRFINSATVRIEGCNVVGNKSTDASAIECGVECTTVIVNTVISGNFTTEDARGAVLVSGAYGSCNYVTVGKNTRICDNHCMIDGKLADSNVYLQVETGRLSKLASIMFCEGGDAPEKDMFIGVASPVDDLAFEKSSKNYVKYVFADNAQKHIAFSDGAITLVDGVAFKVNVVCNFVGGENCGTADSDPVYAISGEEVVLTYTVEDGYTFDGFTCSDAVITEGKFVMPEKDITVTANFSKISTTPDPDEPANHTLLIMIIIVACLVVGVGAYFLVKYLKNKKV